MPCKDMRGPRTRSPRPSVRFGGLKRGIRKNPIKYSKKRAQLKYGKGKPVILSKKAKSHYPKKAKVNYKIDY